jgi:hypothetical protein
MRFAAVQLGGTRTMWNWVFVLAAVIAAIVTGLFAAGDPASLAHIVFPLFLVALIAAGLRAAVRRPHA